MLTMNRQVPLCVNVRTSRTADALNQLFKENHMERRIGVRGIAYQNGKLLSVLHKDHDGNPVDFWAIPGGGLDSGESIEACVQREMIEETGIAPKVGRLLFVQQFLFPTRTGELREQLEFFFHLENPNDYATVDLTTTTHGVQELADITWIDPKTSNVLPAFLQTLDLDGYLTADKPVYIWNELPAAGSLLDVVNPAVDPVA